jgi:hypothetical protein
MVANPEPVPPRYPGAPRWVKVFGIIALAGAVVFVISHLAGGGFRHGHFGQHKQGGAAGLQQPR